MPEAPSKLAAIQSRAMPKAVLKLLMLLVLAVAVPAQGIAAVTAAFCMAMGHHQGKVAGAAVENTDGGHDHAAMMAGQPQTPGDSPAPEKQAAKHQCPPCVSCCAVGAIAPEPQVALPDAPPGAAIAALDYAVSGVLPERLDRPPLAL